MARDLRSARMDVWVAPPPKILGWEHRRSSSSSTRTMTAPSTANDPNEHKGFELSGGRIFEARRRRRAATRGPATCWPNNVMLPNGSAGLTSGSRRCDATTFARRPRRTGPHRCDRYLTDRNPFGDWRLTRDADRSGGVVSKQTLLSKREAPMKESTTATRIPRRRLYTSTVLVFLVVLSLTASSRHHLPAPTFRSSATSRTRSGRSTPARQGSTRLCSAWERAVEAT